MAVMPEAVRTNSAMWRRDALVLFGFGVWAAISAYAIQCVVGVVGLVALHQRVTDRSLRRGAGLVQLRRARIGPGSVTFIALVGLIATTTWGRLAAHPGQSASFSLAAAVAGLAAAALFGLLTSPLFFLPLVLRDPERPGEFRYALLVSGAMLGVSPLRSALSVAGLSMLYVLPGVVSLYFGSAHGLVIAAVTSPLVAWLSARMYLRRRPLVEAAPGMGPLTGGLRALVTLDVLVSVALVALLVSAVLRPLPLQRADDASLSEAGGRAEDDTVLTTQPLPLALHGGDVWLRPRAHGLSVEASDGGGAGPLRDGLGVPIAWARVQEWPDGAASTRVLLETAGGERYTLCLDRHGVRCDDSWGERLAARVPWLAVLALLVAFLFVLRFALSQAGVLFALSRLVALRQHGEENGLVMLTGTLVASEGARMTPAWALGPVARKLQVEGDVQLDVGDSRVRVPTGTVAALAERRSGEMWRDGARAMVVGKFVRATSGGFREAQIELPSDAWWILGDAESAKKRLSLPLRSAALGTLVVVCAALTAAVIVLGFAAL